MICYQLCCANDHHFEGWYRDSAAFAQLQQKGLLGCPHCGVSDVRQALMAPAITKGRSGEKQPARPADNQPVSQETDQNVVPVQRAPLSDQMIVAFQKIRQTVEQNCENMGDRFAKEAVRIHHGEAEERGIYGTATEKEQNMLREEGVDVLTVPWVRRADS